MELAFKTQKLREICRNKDRAIIEYGEDVANQLINRIADLRAAKSIEDIIVGHPKLISNKTSSKYSIDLLDNYKIIIKTNHQQNPCDESGMVDLSKINRVQIIKIERVND